MCNASQSLPVAKEFVLISKSKISTCLSGLSLATIPILILANLVPLWLFTYFPSFDRPAHLLRQNILVNYDNPEFDYNKNFAVQNLPVPNILSDYMVVVFARFASVENSSKILYSLLFMLLPASLVYYLKAVRPENCYLAICGCLFSYSYHLLIWGNENFCLSIPIFLVSFGYWWIRKDRMGAKEYIVAGILWLGLYFAHILGFAMLIVVVLTSSTILWRNLRRTTLAILPSLPGVALYVWWNFKRGEYFDNPIIWDFDIGNKFESLAEVFLFGAKLGFPVYLEIGLLIFLASYAVLCIISRISRKDAGVMSPIVTSFVVLLLLALVLPKWFILYGADQRMLFIALFFGLPLLAYSRKVRTIITVFICGLTLYYNSVILEYFARENHVLSDYRAALSKIPPRQKLLPLVFPPYTDLPTYHRFYDYYHLEKGGINPFHAIQPIFLVDYMERPPCGDIYDLSPQGMSNDVLDYYDYVLVVCDPWNPGRREIVRKLLANGYRQHYEVGIYCIFNRG